MRQPEIKHCIACEDVRFELRQLITIVGSYGSLPDVSISIGNFAVPVRFCLVFFGGSGDGIFNFSVMLLDPRSGRPIEGQIAPPSVTLPVKPSMSGCSIVFWFHSVIFPVPGDYLVSLLCNGAECYRDTITLRYAPELAAATLVPRPR
jgi:hypothetical protein